MFANTYGKYKNCECGLVISSEDGQELRPIPLTKVSADVTWLDVGIKVTLTQTYKNKETKPVETQYVFPVDDRAAVCGFQAEIEGRTIHGAVKKKQEAREIYEESVKQGKTAFLVEETKPDIFQARIGNLSAGSVATITLTYVTQATAEGNALRFFLPTTIAPRYIPPSDASEAAKVIGDIDYSFFSPCPLEIQIHIETERKALSINSPTHEVKISSKNEVSVSKRNFRTEVQLQGVSTDMDRDFVMLLETEAHHQPRLTLEKSSDSTVAAMITLIPSFKLPPLKCDFIFVIDRSGSMGGEKMEKAKDALQLFLKSLPTDSYFNIMSFGSTFSSLWEGSQKYGEDSLHKAAAHVLEMEANFGGTEIYEPLSTIFQQVQRDGYHRQVIVLTDGEVSNTEEVIALVRENCKTSETRVFALGVGSDASHYLVNGIALAGNGEAQFATLKEGLSGKVQHLLKNSFQPSLTSVKVIWAHSDTFEKPEPGKPHEVVTEKTLLGYGKPAPEKKDVQGDEEIERVRDPLMSIKKFPCIFDGSCYAAYCIYNNPNIIPEAITLSADSPVGPLSVTFPVILEESSVGNIVHTLAAQSVIRELEEELQDRILNNDDHSKKENTAIYLGIKYNLASSLTSFVAVDEKGEIQKDAPVLRTVPNMMPFGYGMAGGGMPPVLYSMCMSAPPLGGSFNSAPLMMSMQCDYAPPPPPPCSMKSARYAPCVPPLNVIMTDRNEMISCDAALVAQGFDDQEFYQPSVEDFASSDSIARDRAHLHEKEETFLAVSDTRTVDMTTDEGKLKLLTTMQRFDGSFPFDQQLLVLFGVIEEEFFKEKAANKCGDSDLVTAVAVVFMELKLSAYQDHWELMVKKSRSWLEGKGLSSLIEKGKRLISAEG